MKKIAIVTSTRAEYGLLFPVIKEFRKYEDFGFKCELIVTGTHLVRKFGHTLDEILSDGIRVDHRIECPTGSVKETDIAENMSSALESFTECFSRNKYNAVVVLGDRYEILSVAVAAMLSHTPLFHIGGGDLTEGAIDDSIRHSITKMSFLHFPSNQKSAKRIIQLGEAPDRVYNVGSTAVDNILNEKLMPRKDALSSIGLRDCKYLLCTYHPETIENRGIEDVKLLIDILCGIDREIIITGANSDLGADAINDYLKKADSIHKNIHVFSSLGRLRYLSLMKYAGCVVGNSSSGIIEAPALNIPTVNIGNRQNGRLRASSIYDCPAEREAIYNTIVYALSDEGQMKAKNCSHPYGDGHASERIADISLKQIKNGIDMKKHFVDIPLELRSSS